MNLLRLIPFLKEDCNRLHDAIDKVIADTDEIIDVLTNRCNSQRAEIRENYKSEFLTFICHALDR